MKNNLIFKEILKEIQKVLGNIKARELSSFCQSIKKAKRIYVVGAGRSGLIAKYLAMRLVRIKKKVFVIGESVCPQVKENDLMIAISGSGETGDVISAVKISRMLKAKIIGITGEKISSLAKLSHELIIIPAQIPKRLGDHYQLRELIGIPERSPIKSLFELCSLIFLEVGISKLKNKGS